MSTLNRRSLLTGVGAFAGAGLIATAASPSALAYTDLQPEAVTWAVKQGMITRTNSTYLNSYVSIGEFIYMLAKGTSADVSKNWYAPYTDVPLDSNYRQYIAWARANGIITTPDKTALGMKNNITRGLAATYLHNSYGSPKHSNLSKFSDVSSRHAHYAGIQWTTDNAGLYGYDDRKFNPQWGVTVIQAINVIYDLFVEKYKGYGQRWIPTDYNRSFTDSYGTTSTYHIYADGINKSLPVGVLYYFEGDYKTRHYAYSNIGNPTAYLKKVLAPEAAKKNMILVAPRSPHRNDGGGNTWWVGIERNGNWFRALARHLTSTFKLDTDNVWMLGYSGGAEFISMNASMKDHKGWLTRGGGVPVGGGTPATWGPAPSMSVSMKSNYKLVFSTGGNDSFGAAGEKGWSALNSAKDGYNYYKSHGYRTNYYVIPNQNHYGYDFAGIFNRAYSL